MNATYKYDTEEGWLNERFNWVTSTDVPVLLGLSQYSSPRLLWLEKRERRAIGRQENEYTRFGKRFEPLVIEDFEQATGLKVIRPHRYGLYCHNTEPLACSIDGAAYVNGELVPVEIKNAWHDAAKQWDTEVPLSYQAQLQTQLAVLGVSMGYFAVWLHTYGPPTFRLHPVKRDAAVIDTITAKARTFRQQVLDGIPPEVDGSAYTATALSQQYNQPVDEVIELDGSLMGVVDEVARWTELSNQAEEHVTKRKNILRESLGQSVAGRLPDGRMVTWKPDKNGRRTLKVK